MTSLQFQFDWKPIAMVVGGSLAVLTASVLSSGESQLANIVIPTGALLSLASLLFVRRRGTGRSTESGQDGWPPGHVEESEQFETFRQQAVDDLRQQAEAIEARHRELIDRFRVFHEFLEYPNPDIVSSEQANESELSECDRQVQKLLQQESQRIYEKIRAHGYVKNGEVDVAAIRLEAVDLINRIARVYSPDSERPLMETSIEQLARAASRLCLHILVLLEQLPLDVRSYNLNRVYNYVQTAIDSYGVYQKTAPWLTYLGRGAYLGRFAAGTNPLTVGAWWLATEFGKRGAQHLIEKAIDRKAIAMLNDLVTVIGVEASNVFSPGFRQRDPAWLYGTELTELVTSFPTSQDSLRESLRQVSALPLKSEYDRIYLYRCLAEHRSAGMRITDPASLERDQRETMAKQLEQFYRSFIHGGTEQSVAAWREDVEQRLDLKLKLEDKPKHESREELVNRALRSAFAFLTSVAGRSVSDATAMLQTTALMTQLRRDAQEEMLATLNATVEPPAFGPPEIDPSDPLVDQFITALVDCGFDDHCLEPHIEALIIEVGAWFRRPADVTGDIIAKVCSGHVSMRLADGAVKDDYDPAYASEILRLLPPERSITGIYNQIQMRQNGQTTDMEQACLVCLNADQTADGQVILFRFDQPNPIVWTSDTTARIRRRKGFLIDDCVITNGHWNDGQWNDGQTRLQRELLLPGSIRSRKFANRFAPLLKAIVQTPEDADSGSS